MKVPYDKKNIATIVHEIIKAYLYDEDESYAYIDLYFETKNGESQTKTLTWGKPSKNTPDEFRNSPEGYYDIPDCMAHSLSEILFPETVWHYSDGTEWDGKTLSEVRASRNAGRME